MIDIADVAALQPDAIVLSPGPQAPDQAGCSLEVVRQFAARIPMLGVCLGHQVIGQAFGATVVTCPSKHGQSSWIEHDGTSLFRGLPPQLSVGRYHSLALCPKSLPDCLRVTAQTSDGIIMAIAHRQFPIAGVQFHPESVLTPCGLDLLRSFSDTILSIGESVA